MEKILFSYNKALEKFSPFVKVNDLFGTGGKVGFVARKKKS